MLQESKTKEVEVDVLISANTYQTAAKSIDITADLLPAIYVKGKRDPVAVYALRAWSYGHSVETVDCE